jgi:hypothetical protein
MSLAAPSEAFKQLSILRMAMLRTLGETWAFQEEWPEDFRQKELESLRERAARQDDEKGCFYPGGVNLAQLDAEELMVLGFTPWSQEYPGMRLIPLWVLPALPPRGAVYCIDGRRVNYSPDAPLDKDTRCGMLAYGVMPLGGPLVIGTPSADV